MSDRRSFSLLPSLTSILLIAFCCHGNSEGTADSEECVRIDAVLNDQKYIYLFHGKEFLKLNQDGVEIRKGKIHEFGGLKPDIDAAVVWSASSGKTKTYFFKGGDYFRLSWLIMGPYKTDAWGSEFEDGIDAAGSWEDHTYFFKGCSVFRLQAGEKHLEEEFPGEQVGFPCDVDAAFPMGDSFYALKGDRVWAWGDGIDNYKPLADLVTLSSWNVCSED